MPSACWACSSRGGCPLICTCAGGWLVKAGQQTQDCALAASGGADQGYKFAIAYLHVQGTEGSEGLPADAHRCGAGRIA